LPYLPPSPPVLYQYLWFYAAQHTDPITPSPPSFVMK
jgi:hypothetical protein